MSDEFCVIVGAAGQMAGFFHLEKNNILVMKGLILVLLLATAAVGQTDFKSTCQNASIIPKLATGLIHLNPLDTYNNGANKDYYQDLALAQFAAIDVLGYGFSLTGFQTGCSNSFYTLVVDKVAFENQNTRMRVVVNFRNPADNSITLWNLVSFTYIVVSRNLNGAYSDIWATVAEVTNPAHATPVAVDLVGAAYQNSPTGSCRVYSDPNYVFTPACSANTAATASGLGGGQVVIHAYIMGFMWNSARSTTDYLSAGVIPTIPVVPSSGQTAVTVNVGASPFGPVVSFHNPEGAMEYIKVAFVMSRYDSEVSLVQGTYPRGSLLLYSSSYIFSPVTTFNSGVSVVKGTQGSATEFNQHFYHLPDTRYAIYGITRFSLPKSSCTAIRINATLLSSSTYSVTTPNLTPSSFFFVADIFTVNVDRLCKAESTQLQTEKKQVGQKSYFTVPTQSEQQYILEDSSAPVTVPNGVGVGKTFNFQYYGASNGKNDTILFQAQIPFLGLAVGAPLKFEFGYFDSSLALNGQASTQMISGSTYKIQLTVNGFIIFEVYHKASTAGTNIVTGVLRGLNADATTANAVITISYLRSITQDQSFWTYLRLFQYSNAYDPTTGCCTVSCPRLTGLNVQSNPPVCVYCDTRAGLVYSPNNGSCACITGYYLDSVKTFQCFPCTALYCTTCVPTDPSKCLNCVTGANLNNGTFTCTCGSGFFINSTKCQQCPYQCQNCFSPTSACSACVDPAHRDITQNCKCITGYFDPGTANCSTCSPTCLTCTNSSSCTSCDLTLHRNLTGAICSCLRRYYELYHTNLTRTCQKCNPECLTCTTSPALCLTCDSNKNRVAWVDNSGRQTCLCLPGFYSIPDGSCVQSNCNADPFCSECEQGLKLCIKCLSSKNRVIKLPESICVCMDGYYPDADNACAPCSSGCGICNSSSSCGSCVPLATLQNNGSCLCPSQTYFAISQDGVRYCSPCSAHCVTCINSTACATCAASHVKTGDNLCICAPKHFVDPSGACLPCSQGCQNCSQAANQCNSCIEFLLLQNSSCQASCDNGFSQIGTVCVGCPSGCLKCTQDRVCYYCKDNYFAYQGNCYEVCPAGTIGDRSNENWNCVPCNEPCKTCINHPSYCTSCLNGKGYLQTSADMQSCVLVCAEGTYASEGVCRVCDFRCASCLASPTNCISCPAGQILYNGGCWPFCPAIVYHLAGLDASCVDSCPDGFYKLSVSKCAPCSIQCPTCSGGPSNCTSCLHGSVSTNGTCLVTCRQNQFSFQGICIACADSCYGCQYIPQNCINCAAGYVKTGSICQKGCLGYQFYDSNLKKCIACGPGCATCSSYNYCTTCEKLAITPRGGLCSSCPYPCASCDGAGVCTSCLSGFYYFQRACQISCPVGSYPGNGVCQCVSGMVSQGQCVTSCNPGYTSISGSCQPCNPDCAQCSGSINSCTRCISGYSIDTLTQRCTSQAQCPYGQQSNYGSCAPICDSGFFFYEGICIYGGCFTGYASNSFDGCIRQEAVANRPVCNTNQYISHQGQCVGTCSNGYYPDADRNCLPCTANCQSCFSSTFCIVCDSALESVAGVCQKLSSCPMGQYLSGSSCVGVCPIGTYADGSKCTRVCGAMTYYMGNVCYLECPSGLRTADACVGQCPANTTTTRAGVCQ